MNSWIQVVIAVTLCGGLLCCKEKESQPSAPSDTNLNPRDAALAEFAKMGVRPYRENDVPFVKTPMMGDTTQLNVLLKHMKEAGVFLALPDCIDMGDGLWKIAPEDVDRGRAVVEKHHLKESLDQCHFE